MSEKVNIKSVNEMVGDSMIPQEPAMQQQPQVDPKIREISLAFTEAVQNGSKPEEVVFGMMQQEVDQGLIGEALMLAGYGEEDVMLLFEQVNLIANSKPADAQQVNSNPQELARNQALAEKQGQGVVETEPMKKDMSEEELMMMAMAKSGIEIKPENKGKFTRWAKARGMGVQEAARKVMANKDRYPPSVVKMANFARNAKKFKREDGGEEKGEAAYLAKRDAAIKRSIAEQEKAKMGVELPDGIATASNVVPFDLNVQPGAYVNMDTNEISYPIGMFNEYGGTPVRPQMNEGGDNDIPKMIASTYKPSEQEMMMQEFLKNTNTKLNVTGVESDEVENDENTNINKNESSTKIPGNQIYLPPNLFRTGQNFSVGNAVNSLLRVGRNLFSGKDLDGDGLKDGVFRDLKNKATVNKLNKYANANYTVNVDMSPENLKKADIAYKKFLFENPTADDQYDAVGNIISRGLEDNNIPINDIIPEDDQSRFSQFLEKNTENLSEAAKKTYEALKKKINNTANKLEEGREIRYMQQAGETPPTFQEWVLQDPVNRQGANAQQEYEAFIASLSQPFGPSENPSEEAVVDNPVVDNTEPQPLDPSIDADGDGIPDTIDIDAGDGTGVGGSFEDAFAQVNKPTIDADFGGVKGALERAYNSNVVKGFEGISGAAVDISANILNPFLEDRENLRKQRKFRKSLNADNLYSIETDPFNSRGKTDINTGLSGSEGDRTTGLYMTQGRLAEEGKEVPDNPGFNALPPSVQKNIVDNMEYGGPKGEEAYLARRDAAIKASMELDKAQVGKGTGKNILLNALPNFIFDDRLGKKLLNFDEETATDFVDVYDRAMKIGKSDDVVGEGISFFQDFSKKDLQNFLSEAGIGKKEARDYVYDQDWYKDMSWPMRQAVKIAMKTKGLKKGGEIVNVDSALLAKLIDAGADIEML